MKTSNETATLLEEIQYRTRKTLDEIADDIEYSRPHINKIKLSPKGSAKITKILKEYYKEILQNVPTGNGATGNAEHKIVLSDDDARLTFRDLAKSDRLHALARLQEARNTSRFAAAHERLVLLLEHKLTGGVGIEKDLAELEIYSELAEIVGKVGLKAKFWKDENEMHEALNKFLNSAVAAKNVVSTD